MACSIDARARNSPTALRCIGIILGLFALVLPSVHAEPTLDDAELAVVSALRKMASGDALGAQRVLEPIIKSKPYFQLAQLVYADALQTLAGRGPELSIAQAQAQLRALRQEALVRSRYVLNERQARAMPANALPDVLIKAADDVRHAIVVDAQASRLLLFERGPQGLRLTRDHYVSIGKKGARKDREGDQRTPVGVYFVTARIKADTLPDFYGVGALPVNYPNEWDMRLGRTGYGIWIHGVPSDTYARPPRASDGCMALSNEHLSDLLRIQNTLEMPVIIADTLNWVSPDDIQRQRREWVKRIEDWRTDWESRDQRRYARHYASSFETGGYDQSSWLAYKARVNGQKKYIRVGVKRLSLYRYPGEHDMVVASFEQDYRSDNFAQESQKRQYWRKDIDGQWRIVYEGAVRLSPEHLRGIPYSARARLTSLD
ncbi:MAG: L,D-transpeptidase [Gammaproteobacteria bacterium]|nr:L,D-transpeptidase [Gammaproteobacteria bacterium]